MKKISFFLLFTNFIFYSCNTNLEKNNTQINTSTKVKRLILYNEDSVVKGSRQELFLQNLGRIMDLQNIKESNNELFIRIWLWGKEESHVIDIKKNEKISKCQIIKFNSTINDGMEYISILEELNKLTPKSGWKQFFESLFNYGVITYQSGTIQNEKPLTLTESSYVQFEIFYQNTYHFFEYLEPSYYKQFDRKSKVVYDFLKFLNAEMDVAVY